MSPAKRKRSASPHCKPNLHDTNTSQNEEEQDGMENINCSGLENSEDGDILSKRQKLAPQGSEVTLNGQGGKLRRSPSVTPKSNECNCPKRIANINAPKPSLSKSPTIEFSYIYR